MKKLIVCLALIVPLAGFGQTTVGVGKAGFRETRDIRYPTSFDVTPPANLQGTGNFSTSPVVQQMPVVVPEGFETRAVGTSTVVESATVTGGRIVVVRSADGSELVTLQSLAGEQFTVATGKLFRMNGQLFHAEGFDQGRYMVRNMADQRRYYFSQAGR